MDASAKLTEEKICQCLKSLNVPVRMNDLKTPSKEFIIRVFDTFLKDLQINISNPILKGEMQKAYDLKQENENLEEKIQELLEKLENMKPTKDELLKTASAKKKKINEFEKHREKVMEEHQHLKEKENNLRTQISNLDVQIITMKEKINELDQLIISSPEKITADVQKIKDQVKEVDGKIQEKEIEKKERKKTYQSLLSVQEYVKNSATKQHEIYSKLQSLSETVQNLGLLEIKCREEREHLKELLSAQEGKETLAEVYDRKAAKIQLMINEKSAEIEETYKRIQGEVSDLKNYSEKLNQTVTQVEGRIDKSADAVIEIVNKCKEAKAVTDKNKAQYISKVDSITEDFHKNCNEVTKKAKMHLKN